MQGYDEILAAAERGRHLIWVCPPHPAYAAPVWKLTTTLIDATTTDAGISVIVTGDGTMAQDVAGWTGATLLAGAARGARLLNSGAVPQVCCSAATAVELMGRSALDTSTIGHVVVAWPETFADDDIDRLDQLLAEARSVPRYVLTADPDAIADLIDRQAHRGMLMNTFPSAPPVDAVQFHVLGPASRDVTIELALDQIDPATYAVWHAGDVVPAESVDLVIAADIPPVHILAELRQAGRVLVLVHASQLPYLRRIAASAAPERVVGREWPSPWLRALRNRLERTLAERPLDGELAMLDPLFARFDPAEVAAALLVEAARRDEPMAASSAEPVWGKLFVNAGRRDNIRPGDMVGALINEVGLTREQIGRVDLRDAHSTVEVPAPLVDQTAEKLSGVTLRGRRLQARRDQKRRS